jgi:hypothetical protein
MLSCNDGAALHCADHTTTSRFSKMGTESMEPLRGLHKQNLNQETASGGSKIADTKVERQKPGKLGEEVRKELRSKYYSIPQYRAHHW